MVTPSGEIALYLVETFAILLKNSFIELPGSKLKIWGKVKRLLILLGTPMQ